MADTTPDWAKKDFPTWATERIKTVEEPTLGQEAKAFGKSALESTPGALGGYAGAEAGAALGSMLGPIGTVVGGLGGGLAGYLGGEYLGEKAGKAIPKPVKEATGFTPEQRAEEKRQMPIASTAGALAPDVAAAAPSLYSLGKFGVTKANELAESLRAPKPIAPAEGLDVVGEKGFKLIQDKAEKLYQARRAEAEQKYNDAFTAARQAQAKGEPFITSKAGKNLIAQLENDKNVIAGREKFGVGEEKVKGIDRLINALKGTTTGGGTAPVGKGLVTSKLTKKLPSETKEKDIQAVVEELRFLRDVDAKGKPYEAYAGLQADYKRDLIKKLENALYEWNPEYKAADEAYKAASAKLQPFKTQLMSGALKGEKFDPKALVKSPEDFGPTFFSDVNGVRQLKEVTQDPTQVANLGKEYVASLLSGKTPAQIKEFASNAKNVPWLKEAGINGEVQQFAQKASTAQTRQNILKGLGYGTAVSTLGYTFGRPLAQSIGL